MSPRVVRWTLVVVALLTFVLALPGVWARSTYGAQVSVDEPQYLMTALSLAHEFDLDVSDEVEEGSFRSFHVLDLNTQTYPVDDEGRRFSPHDPLLPLLLAPAMRFAPDGVVEGPDDDTGVRGWVAARLTTAGIAALAAAATCWVAIRRLGARPLISAPIVTLAFASTPLGPYATQVYPEMAAGLSTIVAIGALIGGRSRDDSTGLAPTTTQVWIVVACINVLPWLAVKYVPVASIIALWLLWGLRGPSERRRLGVVLAVFAVSGVVYAVVHQRIYGGWTVYASGDHFVERGELAVVGTSPNYAGRSRRLIGLLADRSFGIVPWQPMWLFGPLAIAYATVVLRRWRWAIATFAAGYLTATFIALTMHGWWSPGRQIVVVMPIAVASLCFVVERVRVLVTPTLALGLIGVVNWIWLAIEANNRTRVIVVDFIGTGSRFYQWGRGAFPDGRTGQGQLLMLWWGIAFVLSAAAAARLAGSSTSQSGDDGVEGQLPLDLAPKSLLESDGPTEAEELSSPGGVG